MRCCGLRLAYLPTSLDISYPEAAAFASVRPRLHAFVGMLVADSFGKRFLGLRPNHVSHACNLAIASQVARCFMPSLGRLSVCIRIPYAPTVEPPSFVLLFSVPLSFA